MLASFGAWSRSNAHLKTQGTNRVTTEYRIHRSMNRSDIALPFRPIKAISLTNTGGGVISDVLGSHARSLPSSSRSRVCQCYFDRATTRRE